MYKKETKYGKPSAYQKELRRWAKKRYPMRNSKIVADLVEFRMRKGGFPTKSVLKTGALTDQELIEYVSKIMEGVDISRPYFVVPEPPKGADSNFNPEFEMAMLDVPGVATRRIVAFRVEGSPDCGAWKFVRITRI